MTEPMDLTRTPKPGDWFCANCQDLQFARNATCRICGTLREEGFALGMTEPLPMPTDVDPSADWTYNLAPQFYAADASAAESSLAAGYMMNSMGWQAASD